ncbi:hypothetical protein ACFSQP_01885 [Bizionia sediminis]|uniref:Phosphoribosylpyrophosphate synthetase n=1 Tax=Bizionia sediminis TaxID=1737064 RepID=A0ABW5KNG5_9FLAO
MEQQRNELNYIQKYQARGYTSSFKCVENELVELETRTPYKPEDIIIKRTHRFEGMSNPSDMSILFVIETKDHKKGLVTASYGIDSDTALDTFFKSIPAANDHSNDAI